MYTRRNQLLPPVFLQAEFSASDDILLGGNGLIDVTLQCTNFKASESAQGQIRNRLVEIRGYA